MQQVTAFNITVEESITIYGRLQAIGAKLRGQALGLSRCATQAEQTDHAPVRRPPVRSGYYEGAYERACASAPMVSLRGLR